MKLFQFADKIQEFLHRSPLNLKEADEAAMKVRYARYAEYPELAALCQTYFLPEEDFNKCLEIEKNRKQTDEMPSIIIEGSQLNFNGYYLLKLPPDDPRAYILGKLTNCCQTVSCEDSAANPTESIISGITLPTNGFYVLLKANKNATDKLPLVEGKINYDDFKIVGQGFAWWASNNNFTFDSWENLRPDDYKISHPMLREFSKQLLAQYPSTFRVTVGISEHTPKEAVKNRVKTINLIANGVQYQDSFRQALIYQNEAKLLECKNNIIALLGNAGISLTDLEFKQLIPLEFFSSLNEMEIWLKKFTVFLSRPDIKQHWENLFNNNIPFYAAEIEKGGLLIWEMMFILDRQQLLNLESFNAIALKNTRVADYLKNIDELYNNEDVMHISYYLEATEKTLSILSQLEDNGILEPKNIEAVLNNENYEKLCTVLCQLNKEGILNDETRQFLIKHASNGNYSIIGNVLIILHQSNLLLQNMGLFLDKQIDFIQLNVKLVEMQTSDVLNQENLAKAFSECLEKENSEEEYNYYSDYEEEKEGVVDNHYDYFNEGGEDNNYDYFQEEETSHNQETAISPPTELDILLGQAEEQYGQDIDIIKELLEEVNQFNLETLNYLMTHGNDIPSLATLFTDLTKYDNYLVTENIEVILNNIRYAATLSALTRLLADHKLNTVENLNSLIKVSTYAIEVNSILLKLAANQLLTQETYNGIIQKAFYGAEIINALTKLENTPSFSVPRVMEIIHNVTHSLHQNTLFGAPPLNHEHDAPSVDAKPVDTQEAAARESRK